MKQWLNNIRDEFDAWCLRRVQRHHYERLWESAEILIELGSSEYVNGDAQQHIDRAKDEIYEARLKMISNPRKERK